MKHFVQFYYLGKSFFIVIHYPQVSKGNNPHYSLIGEKIILMKLGSTAISAPIVLFTTYIARSFLGSIALLLHFDKVLARSKFALLKCENEVNPVARIPWATSTEQIEIVQC